MEEPSSAKISLAKLRSDVYFLTKPKIVAQSLVRYPVSDVVKPNRRKGAALNPVWGKEFITISTDP